MMLLVDSNIWLELLLEQERADDVRRLLDAVPSNEIAISHFSLHSIGVILGRYKRHEDLTRFITELFINGSTQLATVSPEHFERITDVMQTYRLDFDDAYQYVAVKQMDADLVSFDADFDRTDLRRRTPAEIVASRR